MKKIEKEDKKVVKKSPKKEEELDIIEDTTEVKEEIIKEVKKEKKNEKKEDNFLLIEKDYHGLKVFLSLLVILLLLGLVGYLYYKKVYSSPLVTFTNSLSRYQKELTKDYKDNTYNKISAILDLDLKTDDETKKNGVNILNEIQTNISVSNDKDNTYLEINTKYKNASFLNLKLYSKEENNKNYSYIKLDKYYDNYLKYENKYLQYYSLVKLLHEEDLSELFKIIEDSTDKKNFNRSNETIDNVKLTKNTMEIKSDEVEKLLTKIIEKIKDNNKLLEIINKYFNNFTERFDNYLEKVKSDPKDLKVTTYNKINLHQDLYLLEYEYGDKKITFDPKDNVTTISIDNNDKETEIVITKNNKASYNIDFDYKKDDANYKFNLIATLDKTNDVPTIIINDDMNIKELNNETLPTLINEVKDDSLKNILKVLQKKSS